MTFNSLRSITGDNEHLSNSGRQDALQNMLNNGFALREEHWLWDLTGEFLHPGAFSRGQDDCLHSAPMKHFRLAGQKEFLGTDHRRGGPPLAISCFICSMRSLTTFFCVSFNAGLLISLSNAIRLFSYIP